MVALFPSCLATGQARGLGLHQNILKKMLSHYQDSQNLAERGSMEGNISLLVVFIGERDEESFAIQLAENILIDELGSPTAAEFRYRGR